ncbi:MAG: hypothetical protein OXI49_04925 [Acidobacteriota bacterium]|nr:hypothetical protein [Acidobacteriota bacterium]
MVGVAPVFSKRWKTIGAVNSGSVAGGEAAAASPDGDSPLAPQPSAVAARVRSATMAAGER